MLFLQYMLLNTLTVVISKFENLSTVNSEILVKKSPWLLRNCILSSGTFLEAPGRCAVLLVLWVCLLVTGDAHMSPGVLADLWKEEQDRIKILEEKMKVLLREKQVMWLCRQSKHTLCFSFSHSHVQLVFTRTTLC